MGYRLKMTEERFTQLSKSLYDKMDAALTDRRGIEAEWRENDALYNGKVMHNDFPFINAPSYPVPLAETYINAVSSRLADAIHAPEPIITVRNRGNRWAEAARAATDFLEYVNKDVLKLRDFTECHTFGLAKHGTAHGFLPWQVLLESRRRYNPDADDVEQVVDVKIANPTLLCPRIDDVLAPKESMSMQLAPWKAYRVHLTEDDLDMRVFSGIYNKAHVERIRDHAQTDVDDRLKDTWEQQGFSTSEIKPFYEIWEWYGLEKLPGHKYATRIIVPYHMETRTPLSALVNFYPHQAEPFFSSNFQRPEVGLYGRGLSRMVRSGCREVDDLHKNRVINAMLANTKCYKVKKGTWQQMPRNFEIWPGKVIPLAQMDDLQEFSISDIYGSTLNEEMITRRTLEQLSGLVDFSLTGGGGEGLKRVGATPALVAVQESGRVLNYRLNHLRTMYSSMAAWTLELYGHFRPMDVFLMVLGDKGTRALLEMFDAPEEAIRGQMFVELTASSATINREIEKQADLVLTQIMGTYLEKYFQLAALLVSPQLPPPLRELGVKMGTAMNTLMTNVLRDFNKRDDTLILPELADVFASGAGNAALEQSLGGVPSGITPEMAAIARAAAQRAGLGGEAQAIGALSAAA